ncbi:hypothetical protein GCM10027598_71440 [Amycolatopsis oliviviridis]|uniref:Carrier domain-containing protein n=1 Tax=Amycolatopsis oliviviridis TaxID=1471590 RepID=A0ABQ3L574_9PSEU|nr:non-ribosomal peptide synthetase [Amycolatopsis oliviviridis]GHH01430.1 hypothetical protein GCM10017790_01370 [Amycolatopsis oliviviridis]
MRTTTHGEPHHGLVLRLTDPARIAAARAAVQWHQHIDAHHDAKAARLLRYREARRPVDPGGPPVRTVLTTYADATADLVVVAARRALDHAGLRAEAHRCAGGCTGTAPPAPVVPVAAAAIALSRYTHAGSVRVGTPGAALAVDVDDGRPVVDFLDTVAAALADAVDADAEPPPCVVLAGQPEEEDYVPFPAGAMAGGHAHDEHGLTPDLVEDFARHAARVAAALATPGGRVVGDLDLLDHAEAARVVALGRAPVPGPAGAETIHEAFRNVVARDPDAVAVCDATRRMTYRELDARSTAWARVLVDRGATGGYVGVCLKRTVELVVGLLAVLKAGAAYVPMEVQSPDERLRHTAADSGAALVVTGISGFPAEHPLRPADLDVASDAELPARSPDSPAYAVYTSGTTGKPKGVVVPHGNVLALITATEDDLGLGPADVWTFFHSAAFDFSVWEIWGCLLTGGRLVVVPALTARSPEEFADLLVREHVSVLSQTPSAFAALSGFAGPAPRLVVFGGEALDPHAVVGWLRERPATRMVNMYGITETTVHVTSHDVDARHPRTHCVGRPLPGWTVSVRDSRARPLPLGAVGEICVGGAGLAHGYLHRPELTSARFVDVGGERLYRSGDLGRLNRDGTLDHLGRLDDQVKIRGHRVELGEIRSVLLDDQDVTDAAVIVLDHERGAEYARIVAYVVLRAGAEPRAVRHRIAAVLPDYMLPADLVPLPVLPLTGNGKLDHVALPGAAVPSGSAAGPGSPVRAMVALWRSVVRGDLHEHTHFFDELGGNSLLAVRLLTALRKAGYGSLALRDLYRHPTPAALADSVAVD